MFENLDDSWIGSIKPVFKYFEERTPGTVTETQARMRHVLKYVHMLHVACGIHTHMRHAACSLCSVWHACTPGSPASPLARVLLL